MRQLHETVRYGFTLEERRRIRARKQQGWPAMGITVRELLEHPELRTRLVAGEKGLDRPITWAHVCELEDPTVWLCGGELVMTVGIGIPRDEAGQVAYVERLARAQLSGLMICEGMRAPPLTEAMLETADRWGLPVLLTAYEVPFVAVSRVVADANRGDEHERLRRTLQIYEVARLVVQGALDEEELRARLERVLAARLVVLDLVTGRELVPPADAPTRFVHEVSRAVERYPEGQLPAVVQLPELEPGAIALAVPARGRAFLVVMPKDRRRGHDVVVLRHAATVLALALERKAAERERQQRLAAELFAQLADRRIGPDLAVDLLLREYGFPEPPFAVAAVPERALTLSELHTALERGSVPHAVLRRDGYFFILLPDRPAIAEALVRSCPGMPIGWSEPIRSLVRVPEALTEARWAVQVGRPGLVRYAEMRDGAGGWPLTLEAAQELVGRVLVPLREYDAVHGTELLDSLRVFLECEGSWSATARRLGIHRQTLVYRLRRVETLTGLRVDRVGDLAMLWLAMRAAEVLGLLGSDSVSRHMARPERQ